jgi:hypothetical protein
MADRVMIALMIVTERQHVPTVFNRLRPIGDAKAYVMPILDVLG